MRPSFIVGGCVIIVGATMFVAGCSSNATQRDANLLGAGFHETIENPKTWTVNVPVGTCWRITWRAANGEVVHTECGNGPAAGPTPPAYSNSDFACPIDCSECEGSDIGQIDPWPHGGFPYVLGTAPEDWTQSQEPIVAVSVTATSYTQAANKLHAVAQNGPGSVLPSGTEVEAYVTYSVDASGVTLYSSLAQRFASYTITLNGQVIADKAEGLNAVPTSLANGWVSVASAIPSIPSGATIVLTQRRQGIAQDVVLTLTF